MSRYTNQNIVNNINKVKIKALICLDRDGIINHPVESPIKTPEQFIPIDGSLNSVARLRRMGCRLVFIFNQPGILKKQIRTEDVDKVNAKMFDLLGQAGCPSVDGLYYSTSDLKEDTMSLPNNGMLKKAEQELKYPLKGGYMVGDDIAHLKAADNYHMIPVLIKTGNWEATSAKLNTFANRSLKTKTKVFNSLSDFTDFIQSLPS